MLITRECDYAIRTVRALADGEIQTVREICATEHIPQQYAYKILKKLEKARIVNAFRGTYGGYKLYKCPTQITIYDILLAVNDNVIVVNECLEEDNNCSRNTKLSPCAVHKECRRLENLIITSLQEKTLADLLAE